MCQRAAFVLELVVERLGLGQGARKAVEQHAVVGVRLAHALDDHA